MTKVSISQGSHDRFSSSFRQMKEEAIRKKIKEKIIGKMRKKKAKARRKSATMRRKGLI